MAAHSSTLVWRILWTEEPGEQLSMGLHRVRHNWSDFACMHALEREMATHSSVLAWRIPGTGEPGGRPSRGHRVGHDWSNLGAARAELKTHIQSSKKKKNNPNFILIIWKMAEELYKAKRCLIPNRCLNPNTISQPHSLKFIVGRFSNFF